MPLVERTSISNLVSPTGGNPMMRTSIGFAVLAGVFLVSGCGSKEFKEFKSAGGGFKVLMPGTPKEQTQNTPGGVLKMLILEERNGAYMAGYADTPIPPNEPEAKTQVRLDGARDGAVLARRFDFKNARRAPCSCALSSILVFP
jgi:hypothetical protein